MDEIFEKISAMMGGAFQQGMAYQKMLDAQNEFNAEGAKVAEIWDEVRASLSPEGEVQ